MSARYELVGMDYAEHGGGAYPSSSSSAPPQGNVAIVHFIHGAAELFDWRPDMPSARPRRSRRSSRARPAHSGS